MDDLNDIKEKIIKKALVTGFKKVGITRPNRPDTINFYKNWLNMGFHGEMHYLSRTDSIEKRGSLNNVLDGVRSVIVFLYPYENNFFLSNQFLKSRVSYSNYSMGKDYHILIGNKLNEICIFIKKKYNAKCKYYVDTGPVLERHLARDAGLGFIGKNKMLIDHDLGSNFFIGEILTDLDLREDHEEKIICGNCKRCINNCPTNALSEFSGLDSNLCISYLTIEYKGIIPVELRSKMGNHIFGCDICQEVCPWNKKIKRIDAPDKIGISYPFKLNELLDLKERRFHEIFTDTPVGRIGFDRFLRNVIIAAGNSFDISLINMLKKINKNGPVLAAQHAPWAIKTIFDNFS